MHKTSTFAFTHRTFLATLGIALTATAVVTVGGCNPGSDEPNDIATGSAVGAPGGTLGSPGGTSTVATAPPPGAMGSGAGVASNTPAGALPAAVGGTGPSAAPVDTNNTVPVGTQPGATGQPAQSTQPESMAPSPAAEPCEDVVPPPTEEWPDATCENWANETEECAEAWFADYCDISCGRCVPEGAGGVAEPEPEPCEDVVPPPTEEWPDATCENWANETEECAEDWFADYCDISCGRCVPESNSMTGTPPEPEPEVCEDVVPPPTEEWPDATCENWALETDECGADWFADYCDISCGRCVPEGGLPPTPMAPDCSGEGLPNVTGGEGFATRYWDCCQTHCSQFNGHRCGQDGVSGTGDGNSACNGGGSFACYDEAPRAVSECLSYGHIAKSNPDCGGCYRIQFTGEGEHNATDPGSRLIKGKQMIVKVTNTGGDVAGNQFDLMIPGGGVGQFNACSRQWNQNDLGAQYGGFLTNCSGGHSEKKECVRQECMKIPEGSARDGCIWFVDWMEVADNPRFTSEPTNCPF